MKRAIWIAKKELKKNKIPIGTILVYNNFELGIGYNVKRFNYCYLSHAEIITLKQSSFYCSNRMLKQSIIYTTLEPCFICKNSILIYKVKKIIYGTKSIIYNEKNLKNNIKIKNNKLEKKCKILLYKYYKKIL